MKPPTRETWRHAIGITTAASVQSTIDDRDLVGIVSEAIAESGAFDLAIGQGMLTLSIARGMAAGIDQLLSDPILLRSALVRALDGRHMTPAEIGMDPASIIARAGARLAVT